MTWRLGPVDQRTGGGRPPSAGALAVPWPAGKARVLGLLVALAGALTLLAAPVPAASAADSCANAAVRTGFSAALPDCRAYEMVTPADKGGSSLIQRLTMSPHYPWFSNLVEPSVSGDRFYTYSPSLFANPRSMKASQLVSVRSAAGWQTTNTAPAACRSTPLFGFNEGWTLAAVSADFSTSVYNAGTTKAGVELGCDSRDHAGADLYQTGLGKPVTWVSQNGQPKTTDVDATLAGGGSASGISADGSHVLFTTPERFFPEDAGRVAGQGLYDRTGGRTVPVGVKTDGSLVNPCGAVGAITNVGGFSDQTAPWVISRDNRVMFFTSGVDQSVAGCKTADGGGQLYARIDGTKTVLVSGSQRTSPDPTAAPIFRGATPDGRKVYFTSPARLTDDATTGGGTQGAGGLYEYDLTNVLNGSAATGTLRFLSPSVDGNPAKVDRLLRVVGDGQAVYFLARGVLANGATSTIPKVYRSVGGQVQLVVQPESGSLDLMSLSISPDGSKVIYRDQPAGQPFAQVYLVNGDGSGTPVCVSCAPAGSTPSGAATLVNANLAGALRTFGANPFVTDDGRVFFGSPDRLAAGDRDNYWDVYEYRAGQRYLITPGTDTVDALLVATGPDGRDVFFAAGDSLTAKDFDNGDQDIYTARVGGGFPAPPAPKIPCAGDACQPPAPAPALAVPGSVAFVAPFVPVSRAAPAPKAEETKTVSVKRPKTVRGKTRVRLSVKAPEAGRIRVSGSGLRRAKKTAKKAKTYRVTVKLSKRSKRILKRKHRVKVRATVRFTPKHGKRSRVRVRVTFKTKKHHGKGSRRSHDRGHRSDRKGGR